MNIIFAGSKGKTGSVIFEYLKEKGYKINSEVNLNEEKLISVIKPSSIVIDFTNSQTAVEHANICLKNNSHFICGTTGIDEDLIYQMLKDASKTNLSFIFSPNFSTGITKIIKILDDLKNDFNNTKIVESHHISKKDLPSGTALLLKKHLKDETQIESIRTTYQTLDHTIYLKNNYEEITIIHSVKNKLAYAKGVEKALIEIISKIKESSLF